MEPHVNTLMRLVSLAMLLSLAPAPAWAQDKKPDKPAVTDGEPAEDSEDSEDAEETDDEAEEPAPVETKPAKAKSKAAGPSAFRVVYVPPGCLDGTGSTTFSMGSVLERHFEINNGDVYRTSYGPAALSNGPESIFPDDGANDAARVNELDEAGELEWQVVEEDFPALVSPWETLIQVPFRGHFDWLSIVETQTEAGARFADAKRVTGKLMRATLPDGRGLLRFDHPDQDQDPIYVRKWVTTYDIVAPDDAVQIVAIGESLGRGSRLRPAILDRLEDSAADSSIVLHSGAVVSPDATAEHRALCGDAARGLNPMALVPRSGELSLGATGLTEFASSFGLRYVAANLVARESDTRPFRRFSILNLDGLTIAVIGVVGSDQLARLPRGARNQWRLTDPVEALAAARVDLETQLQKQADLTIVLLSTEDGAEFSRLSSVPGVDVVIGPFDRADLVPFREEVEVEFGAFRDRRAAVRVGGNPIAVGEIIAKFEERDGQTAPVGYEHTIIPVRDEGQIDANLHRNFIPVEEAFAASWSAPILPDLVPIFRADDAIRKAAANGDAEPRGFNDSLWSTFVANELRRAFSADVAILGRQKRDQELVGALTKGQLSGWLDDGTQVRVVELSGAELRAIAAHDDSPDSAGFSPLHFAGYDPTTSLVEGRALRDRLPYRVVLTDDLLERDALDAIFGDKRPEAEFAVTEDGYEASDSGEVVTVETAMLGALGDDVIPAPQLRRRLADSSKTRDHQWRFDLRALSVRAQSRTAFGDQDYGQTRETALRVPNSLEVGYRLDALLRYDGPAFAWDLGAFAQFDRLTFGDPESSFEPYDELVFETEGRANIWGFEVGDSGFPLIPALGVAYDTEATPLPDATDPTNDLSRQSLLRVHPSLVAFPGDYLRRVDLGPVVQLDMTDGGAHIGLEAAYRLVFPIVGALEFESQSTLRYLFPGSSEDGADLALRIESRNAFVHPLVAGFGLALYADLYLAQGQTDVNDGIGGLFSAGAALRYDGSFRF